MEKRVINIRGLCSQAMRRYGIYLILLLIVAAGSVMSPVFLTAKNIMSVGRQVSVTGILAFAETILIIGGNVDLSLGSQVALSGMISINTYLATGSAAAAFASAVAVCVGCSLFNAFAITKLQMPGFVATMSMDFIARGAVYVYCKGTPIYQVGDYGKISSTYLFGVVPLPVVFLMGVAVLAAVVLRQTCLGRNIYAVGGNAEAAFASGISVSRTKFQAFAISGLFTGVAAVIQMARLNTGMPDTANGYHGDAIAAAVIGGASFTGGTGTAAGTLVGAFVVGFISNILNLKGVSIYVQQIIKGILIIIAVSVDIAGKNRKIRQVARGKKGPAQAQQGPA